VNEIVVDASITLSWCFPDEQTPSSLAVLDRLKTGDSAIVPALWSVEVLNSLLVGERRGRISPEHTQAFLRSIEALRPTLDNASLNQVIGPVQKLSPCAGNVHWQLWTSLSEMRRWRSAFTVCEWVATDHPI
jgi:hypothetical protein